MSKTHKRTDEAFMQTQINQSWAAWNDFFVHRTAFLPETTPTPAATNKLSSVDGPVRRKPRLSPMARRKNENRSAQFDCGGGGGVESIGR